MRLACEMVGADVPHAVLRSIEPIDASPDSLQTAREIALDGNPMQPWELLRLGGSERLWAKVGIMVRRVFLSRDEINSLGRAGAIGDSPFALARFYLVRLQHLLRRYGPVAVNLLLKKEPDLNAVVVRGERLRQWLRAPRPSECENR